MTTPSGDHSAYLWRGFDHAWLRTVAGFCLPHRISRMASVIDGEHHDGAGDAWRSRARFTFAQATGVDGNFMRPQGFWSAISAPGLTIVRGAAAMAWTDEVVDHGGVPRAESEREATIDVDLGRPGLACAIVLRGFELTTACDDAKQPAELPCNSHGMWPYELGFAIGPTTVAGGCARATARVRVARGWTPMRGGVPGIEEKPLNRRLDLSVTLHYTAIAGPPEIFAATRGEPVAATGSARAKNAVALPGRIDGAGGDRYPLSAIAVHELGFSLHRPAGKRSRRLRHRGRYLGALRFAAGDHAYDPATGRAELGGDARVWVPITVVATDVHYRLGTTLLQLAGEDARATPPRAATGSLCNESSPQAPFFSRWKKCGGATTGPARAEDTVAISSGAEAVTAW